MLSVFICEDDIAQRERIETYIKNYIIIEDLDMELVLSTQNPFEILEYLKSHSKTTGLYFLDVDLQAEISGLELAAEIRDLDDLGKIVFVTTHGELSFLTFTYKIEAMDYIIKDRPEEIQRKVQDCVKIAHKRYLSDKNPKKEIFKVKIGDKVRSIYYSDIMFFESSAVPHKIILHLENSQLEFYGSMKEVEKISDCFYRCHKSYVINKNNIQLVDKKKREVKMVNEETCLVSVRALKGLD
ncbi:LytR/AlgR family response regulator transcription factor [Bacillus cytotoxicus]|uniref:LytR/AlgR family response regulator transcription factor n=1 Tax=Bacillus cereus group sp. BfR-BA-01492 TaxID=2920361 RepID=UPI001F5AC104|nr:LytTR family DNA-binding domain-containing protein [Bacillus cereus group sp. BfR-BA-01492]EMA6343235.1 response regulator transcription factor [Bacillus cytotoxicus]